GVQPLLPGPPAGLPSRARLPRRAGAGDGVRGVRASAGRSAAAVLNPRPARETLALAGRNRIAWAEFDPGWYLARHPEAAAALCDPGPDAVLGYYLDTGAALRHSPNALFDEAWYLEHHPGVAAAVEAGHFRSGFDHY